ncbi:MAG: DeoR/GlpR family DNA-binding transcription regulator [Caldicoprobacterales bacterium]
MSPQLEVEPKMNATQRRMEIYALLQKQTTAEVNDLAERFGVSTMTIRRDLALFEKQGLVVTNYGGAYLNKGAGIEPAFAVKQGQMKQAKQSIARKAAELVKDGDSIVLDCGTTPLQIVNYILQKRITIITNSWPVVNHIHGSSKAKLILAPGEYNEVSAGVISSMTMEFYRNFHADIVFISTQGFSAEQGGTVPDPADADVKRSILNSGKRKVLVADHTKLGKVFLAKHAEPHDFDVIITDDQADEKYIRKLKKVCGQVMIAEKT